MIYEVCTLVATIILGMLGIELILWVRSVRKLTDETKQTVKELNSYLPSMLGDIQALTSQVRQTTEQIGGTVSEVAVSLDKFRRNPLHLATALVESIKHLMGLWQEIRGRKKETPND